MKILFADDDQDIQMLVEMTLMEEGHEVVTADNGREAVELASSQPFDVILLDRNMPVMGGVEAFDELIQLEKTAHIPIIFMTANAADPAVQEALKRGAKGTLDKPFDVDSLGGELVKILNG